MLRFETQKSLEVLTSEWLGHKFVDTGARRRLVLPAFESESHEPNVSSPSVYLERSPFGVVVKAETEEIVELSDARGASLSLSIAGQRRVANESREQRQVGSSPRIAVVLVRRFAE
jgi:hypothetical protein